MAKKHNKSRKQKPNYSKKNKGSPNIETASELEPEIKEVSKKTSKENIYSEEE